MNKPTLCKILGVEVNEKFAVSQWMGKYWVDGKGQLHRDYWDDNIKSETVCKLIACPQLVMPLSKWTHQDREDAKAIKRLFPGIETVTRRNDGKLFIHDFCEYTLNPDTFVSLGFDESVELDEIINSEAVE